MKSLKYKKKHSKEDFSNVFDWCVGNILSIHFWEGKTESIFFSSRHNSKLLEKLDIYKGIEI